MEAPPWGWRIGWPTGSLAGALCVAAAVAGLPVSFLAPGLAACAVAAALVLGLVAERVLRRAPVTDGVGALAGIVVALLAHPAMALVYAAVVAPTGEFDNLGELTEVLVGVPALTLLYWGWVTLPVGGLGGWVAGKLVMRRWARLHRPTAATTGPGG